MKNNNNCIELQNMIMNVEFKQAENIFLKLTSQEQRDIIEQLAYDTESMIIYLFVQYLNQKSESVMFHEMEFDMLTNALCHIEGAYQMALFHNQRLLELLPDSVKYMEWMLSFYDIRVIDIDKTLSIANRVLELDCNNVVAKNIIERLCF